MTTSATGRRRGTEPGWTCFPPASRSRGRLEWHTELRLLDIPTSTFSRIADRVPNRGITTSTRKTASVVTRLDVAPAAAPIWEPNGTVRTDSGTLRGREGRPVVDRIVRIEGTRAGGPRRDSDATGTWRTTYVVSRNTSVRAYFGGDGVQEPVRSETYTAHVRACVSLDLPEATTVRLHDHVALKGVVRPRQSGSLQVMVRQDRPGATYRLLRDITLVQGRYDSYYRTTWAPVVRGRYVLRTQWKGGTTAPGGVMNGWSTHHRITVD